MPSTQMFQTGDLVKCVDSTGDGAIGIAQGTIYTVSRGGSYILMLEGVTSYQYAWRFTKIGHLGPEG